MPAKPKRPPIDAIAMVLSASRRDVVLARALVSSSSWSFFASIFTLFSHRSQGSCVNPFGW
jgi:hypothetical protein